MTTKQNYPTRIYRKVYVSDRIPDTHFESYSTDKGLMFEHQLVDMGAEWWLEEIELPSEEEIYTEAGNNSKRTHLAFERGASFILNHIKGGGE